MTRGDPSFSLKGNATASTASIACAASVPTSPVSGKLPATAENPGSRPLNPGSEPLPPGEG